MAVGEHLHLELLAGAAEILIELHQPVARQLHRHHPALHPLFEQHAQHVGVVGVDGGTADERQPGLAGELDRAQIVGLDHQLAVVDQPFDLLELGGGGDESQGGEHRLLARAGHLAGEGNPVIRFQFAALAADGFPQIDDVGLALGGRLIEAMGVGLGPVEEQGAEREFHGWAPYCHWR